MSESSMGGREERSGVSGETSEEGVVGGVGKRVLSGEEKRARLGLVESLLVSGASSGAIERTLFREYGTTRGVTKSLCDKVRAQWAEEERERRPFYKAAQIRRVTQEVNAAKSLKVEGGVVVQKPNWGAVAQLENLLADLTGTREPLELKLEVDVRVSEALLHVVSTMSPDRVRELARKQRELRELAAKAQERGIVLGSGTRVPGETAEVPEE